MHIYERCFPRCFGVTIGHCHDDAFVHSKNELDLGGIQQSIQENTQQESREGPEHETPEVDPEVAVAGPVPKGRRDEPRIERSSPAPWKTWLPLAAAILLSILVLNNIFESGLSESREQEFTAEIIDPPADTESIILVPEDEDGVIMITFTNG